MSYSKFIQELANSVQMLKMASDMLFKKFAQLTPEETQRYKSLLDSKLLFRIEEIKDSAGRATKSALDRMSSIMETMDNNEKQIQVLDLDLKTLYNQEYQNAVKAGKSNPEEINAFIVDALSKSGNSKDFSAKKSEKKQLASEQIGLRSEFNKLQASIIITNGIHQKINKKIVDIQSSSPTAGGSRYIEGVLERYHGIIGELDNIITALAAQNVGGKAAPEAIELTKIFGPEAFSTQFLLRPKATSKQSSAIPADLETITLDEFKQSPIYYVKKDRETKKLLAGDRANWQVDAQSGEKILTAEGQSKLDMIMNNYDDQLTSVFEQINAMPDTYQKYATMAKYLDPPATVTRQSAETIKMSLEHLGGDWKRINDMQKLKLPAQKLQGGMSDPEVQKLIKDKLIEVSNVRAYSAERLKIEAQDPRNHYAILLAITDMAAESGYPRRTAGQQFLDSISSEQTKNDPQVIEEAKKLDSVEANNFHVLRDILIDESSNEQVPTWLLMKIIDTFSVVGVATSDQEKDKFRSINRSVMAVASKALENRGWKVETDANGVPKKQLEKSQRNKDRSGEVGILFQKIGQEATASSKSRVTVAQTPGAGPLAQLQSQADDMDKKITQKQAEMAQLQQQKVTLDNQIKGEKEREAQIQKAQQAQAAQAQMTAAQSAPAVATNVAPGAVATPTAKYKVVYKNANK